MITISNDYKNRVLNLYKNSGIVFTDEELNNIDFADFGLSDIEVEGLNLILYVNNDRYCAKEMVLLPNQTCPEHLHPDFDDKIGKQETFRCRWGEVFLVIESEDESNEAELLLPENNKEHYTAKTVIHLLPGEQYTIDPGIKHWFKAGEQGAVISEFSSPSYDEFDIFTNPNIVRTVRDR